MNVLISNNMLAATRLTREGRLNEATALLQRALNGLVSQTEPNVTQGAKRRPALSRIVHLDPDVGDSIGGAAPSHSSMPNPIRGPLSSLTQSNPKRAAWGETTDAIPKGAEFLHRTYESVIGSRGYKLYIPSTFPGESSPLIVMLHGCTQSPDDFAAGTRMNALAEEHGCLVAYPGQTQAANAQKCWNWFNPGDQARDQGEPALIAGITREIIQHYAVDPRRVYIAGLSAGGAAAAIMGVAYPELYAAIGVHSGLACGAARDVPSAFAAMRQGGATARPCRRGTTVVPTIVFHADKDATVHPRNGHQVIAQSSGAEGLRTEVRNGQVPGGHAYSCTIHSDRSGHPVLEHWVVYGGGHAWSGGSASGTYTDPRGPDASREMLRFFLEHPLEGHAR